MAAIQTAGMGADAGPLARTGATRGSGNTARTICRLKANSARQLRDGKPDASRIWAPAFHDHAIRREQAVLNAARYIVLNPVRAGLVAGPAKYPYWDAVWLGRDG